MGRHHRTSRPAAPTTTTHTLKMTSNRHPAEVIVVLSLAVVGICAALMFGFASDGEKGLAWDQAVEAETFEEYPVLLQSDSKSEPHGDQTEADASHARLTSKSRSRAKSAKSETDTADAVEEEQIEGIQEKMRDPLTQLEMAKQAVAESMPDPKPSVTQKKSEEKKTSRKEAGQMKIDPKKKPGENKKLGRTPKRTLLVAREKKRRARAKTAKRLLAQVNNKKEALMNAAEEHRAALTAFLAEIQHIQAKPKAAAEHEKTLSATVATQKQTRSTRKQLHARKQSQAKDQQAVRKAVDSSWASPGAQVRAGADKVIQEAWKGADREN